MVVATNGAEYKSAGVALNRMHVSERVGPCARLRIHMPVPPGVCGSNSKRNPAGSYIGWQD